MKEVGSLRYGTIFKKAFSDTEIFTAFVQDIFPFQGPRHLPMILNLYHLAIYIC